MIKLNKLPYKVPEILISRGVSETDALIIFFRANRNDFCDKLSKDLFKSAIYGDASIKELLKVIQCKKCAFCESYISHIDDGDVEHFRPKAGWKQDENDNELHKPGYFFLAYTWENLLLSCSGCNQRNKKNFFTLNNPQVRTQLDEDFDITQEEILFINPFLIDPELHIEFIKDIPKPKNQSRIGATTIKYLGLDRNDLNEMRLEKFSHLNDLVEIIEDDTISLNARAKAEKILKKRLSEIINKNKQYVSMVKCNFRTYLN